MAERSPALRLGVLTAVDVQAVAPQLAAISARAFAGPPWHRDPNDADRVVSRVALMAQGRGFKMVTAEVDGHLVGFAYGKPSYTGESPPPWEAQLVRALGPASAHQWIRHGFEVVSVVVDPDAGVKGVGTELVRALLKGLPQPTVWFAVDERAEAPVGMAAKTGFDRVARLELPGHEHPRLVFARTVA